jgi:hypothetical protein
MKMVSFSIEEDVLSIWKELGITKQEQKRRVDELQAELNEVYQNFVRAQFGSLEDLKQRLAKAKHTYEQAKKSYGDVRFPYPRTDDLGIPAQIEAFEKAIGQLNDEYEQRTVNIRRLGSEYERLRKELGIENEIDLDSSDFSAARLRRLQNAVSDLKEQRAKRHELIDCLAMRNRKLKADLGNEECPTPSPTKSLSLSLVENLEKENDDLSKVRNERLAIIDRLSSDLRNLYTLLAIDKSDRIVIQRIPSSYVIQELENEISFMESQKEARLPLVIELYRKQICDLCNKLEIPEAERPCFYGTDRLSHLSFLIRSLEALNKRAGIRKEEDVIPVKKDTRTEISFTSQVKGDDGSVRNELSASVKRLFSGGSESFVDRRTESVVPMQLNSRDVQEVSLLARDPFYLACKHNMPYFGFVFVIMISNPLRFEGTIIS